MNEVEAMIKAAAPGFFSRVGRGVGNFAKDLGGRKKEIASAQRRLFKRQGAARAAQAEASDMKGAISAFTENLKKKHSRDGKSTFVPTRNHSAYAADVDALNAANMPYVRAQEKARNMFVNGANNAFNRGEQLRNNVRNARLGTTGLLGGGALFAGGMAYKEKQQRKNSLGNRLLNVIGMGE